MIQYTSYWEFPGNLATSQTGSQVLYGIHLSTMCPPVKATQSVVWYQIPFTRVTAYWLTPFLSQSSLGL